MLQMTLLLDLYFVTNSDVYVVNFSSTWAPSERGCPGKYYLTYLYLSQAIGNVSIIALEGWS